MRSRRSTTPSFSDAPTLRFVLSARDSDPVIELDVDDLEIADAARARLRYAPLAAAMLAALIAVGLVLDAPARASLASGARAIGGRVSSILRPDAADEGPPTIGAPAPVLAQNAAVPDLVAWPRDSTATIGWQPSATNADWSPRAPAHARGSSRAALHAFTGARAARQEPRPTTATTTPSSARAPQAASGATAATTTAAGSKVSRAEEDAALREAKRALQSTLK